MNKYLNPFKPDDFSFVNKKLRANIYHLKYADDSEDFIIQWDKGDRYTIINAKNATDMSLF